MVFVGTFRRALFAHGASTPHIARGTPAVSIFRPASSPRAAPASPPYGDGRHAAPLYGRWELAETSGQLALRWHAPERVGA